ncbi:proprotein convertase subtilisin/kexin type 4-like isoform X2 [Dendronephthya gigantea]|uniref:proprotein convertase subtilisin/kexin type 4-like isoform X2 n=1 Tax=Dendronephthya gigantea TaxID=151771 RepID=UPI00106B6A60|nr:proprotein convertase subtilisin/kexin type 4-like isoform X2 [Dendronephthya gigantea]
MDFEQFSNVRFLVVWMILLPSTSGQHRQIFDREGFNYNKKSNVNTPRFSSSKYARILPDTQKQKDIVRRKRRSAHESFNDPGLKNQKYLIGGIIADHNVDDVWKKYNGKGITVAVVDDGLKFTHEEFKGRYLPELSHDYIDHDTVPTPVEGHGTNCAGVIAGAANNSICGVGVAYEANIAGIRLTHNVLPNDTDSAKAFYPFDGHKIDIFSNSWGPPDTGFVVAGPGPLTVRALQDGTSKGRGGLGSIYVFSAGNGAFFGDSCSYNGFVNSIYTIPVAAVDQNGKPQPSSEICTAVMTSAYSYNLETAAIASNSACASTFGATSAATALVSGMIALALQARNSLTWRDIQHLIVRASRRDIIDKSVKWTVNKAGIPVSNQVGFGFLDASLLVKNAENINTTLPPQKRCEIVLGSKPLSESEKIISFDVEIDEDQCDIKYLEHVVARFDLEYFKRGVIGANITSPEKTVSQVLFSRGLDAYAGEKRYKNLKTVSVHFWGEPSYGKWTVSLKNERPLHGTGSGTLHGFSLILYGTESEPFAGIAKPDINYCATNTCRNGATCFNKTNSYECSCKTGFTGVNCEKHINYCAKNTCRNGATCFNKINSYECSCKTGFTGVNCEKRINNCKTNPCRNGGTCVNKENSYECRCKTGFTGVQCQNEIEKIEKITAVMIVVIVVCSVVFIILLVLIILGAKKMYERRTRDQVSRSAECNVPLNKVTV